MDEPQPYLASEAEIVRRFYAALNRNDVPAMMQDFAPDVVWTEPSDFPGGGIYIGHASVAAHCAAARANWAEGSCEPEQLIAAPGNKVVVFDYVHVRLQDETEWRQGYIATVYTFHNKLVVHGRVFLDREEALAWAGAGGPTDG